MNGQIQRYKLSGFKINNIQLGYLKPELTGGGGVIGNPDHLCYSPG
jgi:hypothetical protein